MPRADEARQVGVEGVGPALRAVDDGDPRGRDAVDDVTRAGGEPSEIVDLRLQHHGSATAPTDGEDGGGAGLRSLHRPEHLRRRAGDAEAALGGGLVGHCRRGHEAADSRLALALAHEVAGAAVGGVRGEVHACGPSARGARRIGSSVHDARIAGRDVTDAAVAGHGVAPALTFVAGLTGRARLVDARRGEIDGELERGVGDVAKDASREDAAVGALSRARGALGRGALGDEDGDLIVDGVAGDDDERADAPVHARPGLDLLGQVTLDVRRAAHANDDTAVREDRGAGEVRGDLERDLRRIAAAGDAEGRGYDPHDHQGKARAHAPW